MTEEQAYQRTVGMKIMLARILRTIAKTERLGLYSNISKQNLSQWMEGGEIAVNQMIDLYHMFDKEDMVNRIIREMKNNQMPLNVSFADAVIKQSGEEYCCCYIENDEEGMKRAVQEAYDYYHESLAAYPQEYSSFTEAEKVLLFLSVLTLSGVLRAKNIEAEPDVIVEILKGVYGEKLLQSIQHYLGER